MKDGSACVMAHGAAERVRVAGVEALGALIEGLSPSQALALGTLRAGLPDKVEVTTRQRVNGVARPDIIARTGSNIVYHGPAFALLDFDSKGMPARRSRPSLSAPADALGRPEEGAAAPERRGPPDAALHQRRLVARRYW